MVQTELERRVAELRSSRPWTEDEARLVLAACAESGESIAAFARRMKLVPERLFWWRRRLGARTRPEVTAVAAPAFVPLVVRPAVGESAQGGSRATAAVLVCGAVRVEVKELSAASAAWAATLLRSLEGARR